MLYSFPPFHIPRLPLDTFAHISVIVTTERPMKIEIVVDPTRPAPPASLVTRVAPAPAAAPEGVARLVNIRLT